RRHTKLQRLEEILVDLLLLFSCLGGKHLALYKRIVLLGVSRCDLLPVDAELENVQRRGIVLGDLGQRTKLLGQVRHKSRLDESRLDQLFENIACDLEILQIRIYLKTEFFALLQLFLLGTTEPI